MQPRMPSLQIVGLTLIMLLSFEFCTLAPPVRLFPPTATPIVIVVTATPAPVSVAPAPAPALPTGTPAPVATQRPTPVSLHTPIPVPTHTPTSLPTHSPPPMPTATPTPTFTPAPPAHTPTPTSLPYDFVVVHQRIWTNEENGGVSENGTVIGCGYGHQIYVWVIDAAGNPLDGVVIGDPYNNPRHISGEKGPGHAVYDLHMNGYELLVVEDTNVGRPVTSQVSPVMSSNDWEIPIPWLIEGHYCASEEECLARRADPNRPDVNSLCWGHYSYEITFQRTW